MKLTKHKAAKKSGLYAANEQESFVTSLRENQRHISLLELHKQMHLKQKQASQMNASSLSKLHKKWWMHLSRSKASDKTDLLKAVYKQLEAKGKKKMKLGTRKLHNAVNNNNVFEAVWFTCATA